MVCGEGFTAEGEVRLLGAHIGGQLDCDGGMFHNPDGLLFCWSGPRSTAMC
jgi:hypothetical protein